MNDCFPVSKRVRELEEKCFQLDALVGDLLATFALANNRTKIREGTHGQELLDIVDRYGERLKRLCRIPRDPEVLR